jgi:hypothetical protein
MSEDNKGWFDMLPSLGADAHSVTELAEGAMGPGEIAEGAEQMVQKFEGTGIDLGSRIGDLSEGAAPTFAETVEQAQYGAGNAGRLGGLGGVGEGLAPFALMAGVIDGSEEIKEIHEQGANLENTPKLVKAGLDTTAGGIGTLGALGSLVSDVGALGAGTGVAGAGAGMSAAAGAAAPIGMVAGAGAGGMALGDWMGKTADSDATRTGAWGKDDSGKNKSAMDWGAGWGTWVDTHTGDKNAANPSILGGIAAAAGGVAGGFAGTAQAHPLLAAELMMTL